LIKSRHWTLRHT